MSLVLSGTVGVSDVDGSAATPAIRGTDTNTGIFFPAADTIAFAEGGVESARFDSAGNLGIGTTTPGFRLDVNGVGNFQGVRVGTNGDTINGSLGLLAFQTNSTERARIDSSGNLLVGTTVAGSPGLGVSNSANISFPESTANTSFATMFRQASSADLVLGSGVRYSGTSNAFASSTGSAWARTAINVGYGAIKFFTAAEATVTVGTDTTLSERARIDTNGNLLVGTTSTLNGNKLLVTGATLVAGINVTNGTGEAYRFYSNGTAVGTISVTGSATAYNTSSDYRLKNTIAPMTGALARVAALKPCTYKWNVDGSDGEGFIAHELQEVVPQCVTGEKDAVDEDGKPQYQGIDTSFLVATLTAAIQEQQAIITALTARVTALEGTQP
jgi:hypothetical protein